MYRIITSKTFEKDVARCAKRGLKLNLLFEVINLLGESGSLPPVYKPHILSGKLQGFWECHIKGDWLLLWSKNEDQKIISLARTGSHSDLF
jgi:mRNA interferase YafQ